MLHRPSVYAVHVLVNPLLNDLSIANLAIMQLQKGKNYPEELPEMHRQEYADLLERIRQGILDAKTFSTPKGPVSEGDRNSLLRYWRDDSRLSFASPQGALSIERMKGDVSKSKDSVDARVKAIADRRQTGQSRSHTASCERPTLGMSSQRLVLSLSEMSDSHRKEALTQLAQNVISLMERLAQEVGNKSDEGVNSMLLTLEGLLGNLAAKKCSVNAFWGALRGADVFSQAWTHCIIGSTEVKGRAGIRMQVEEKSWTERLDRLDWTLKLGFFYDTYEFLASRDISSSWDSQSPEPDPFMKQLPERVKRCLTAETVEKLFRKKWQEKIVKDFQILDEELSQRIPEKDISGGLVEAAIGECGKRLHAPMTELLSNFRRAKHGNVAKRALQGDREHLRGILSFIVQQMNSPFASALTLSSQLFLRSFKPFFNLSFQDLLYVADVL